MATPADVRVTVEANGAPRTLFSIRERKSGEIIITFRSSEFAFEEIDKTKGADMKPVMEERYSIHFSNNSQNGVSTIKHTLHTIEGKQAKYQLTRALKDKDGFTQLFTRLAPDLGRTRFSSDGPAREILNLGSYEPLRFTFCYSVFVGSPDLDFGIENVRGPAAVIRRKHFQFIVLYLTIPIPSAPIGHTFHFQTFDPLLGKNERETKMLESLMSGASPAQCVYEHNWAIFYLLDQHLDNVETIMPIFSPQIAQMRLMVDRGREKAGIKK